MSMHLIVHQIRRTVRIVYVLLFPLLMLMATACNDDDDGTPARNIAQIVTEDNNFSLLERAVTRANLAQVLSTGSLTVFAPTDAAFQAAGINEAFIDNATPALLTAVLQYHVLGSRQAAADLPAGNNTAVTTLGGGTVYVTKNGNNVSVNGARVTQADLAASNGVIHVIDKVLIPPVGNLVETALANDDNFSLLVAAVQRASQGSTNVAGVLSGAGPFTVFAPVNQAFVAAGFPTVESIQATDPAVLTRILTYHVVSGRVFSTNLAAGAVPTLLQGANVTVGLNNGVQVTGAGNGGTASRVVLADVVATNGVIHAIDRVLLPPQ